MWLVTICRDVDALAARAVRLATKDAILSDLCPRRSAVPANCGPGISGERFEIIVIVTGTTELRLQISARMAAATFVRACQGATLITHEISWKGRSPDTTITRSCSV